MGKAAILVADAVGEWATTSIFSGSNNEIKLLEEIQYPHSLGLLYSAVTFFCGFKVNSGEYKLMGLAPFGRPLYTDLIYDKLIMVNENGSYRLNLEYFAFQMSDVIINERFDDLFKIPRRAPETEIKQGHADVAASMQVVLNEVMVKLSRHAMEIVDSENLCLAGGVALNCVANSKIRDTLKPGGMWVQPAAGDAGGALGAALYVRHNILEERRVFYHTNTDSQSGSFLGPSFSDKDVLQALEQSQLKYDLVEDRQQHHKIVAKQISEGKIVGRFFGKMEFGPRSLGGRSILADPRSPHAQKYVNLKIKFRESWRPFAPAVLAEKKHLWFSDGDETPYMLYTSRVLAGLFDERHEVTSSDFNLINQLHSVAARSRISAVTHVDRSARVQTVDAKRNGDFYDLISEFETLSDCPILLNTSFNIRGEPIVCSPQDAINCFLGTDMDVLSIQNFLIFKQPNKQIICSD
ncbi:UNVERIFIED_CONTAM: hypothetical protein GTU68_041392 [Idotea baltica]|nr:hypothetical protein [Idotea baltica]